jgi:hypothetical protein
MQAAASAGGIVTSEDTRRLVEGYFELRELGPTEVRGVAEPLNLYEVTGAGPLHGHFDLAVRRGLTKFVGRELEIAEMKRAFELACGRHGQIVAVVAEAGTGKSRLFYEFKATLPAECKVLEAYSVSHGKASAWLPVLESLHDYFGIEEADDSATRREKVRAALAGLDPALSDTESYLFALLAIAESSDPLAQMDPQIKRRRTMALKRISLRESVKQPVVIIFEDLHWIDGETQALLDLLADPAQQGICREFYDFGWLRRVSVAKKLCDWGVRQIPCSSLAGNFLARAGNFVPCSAPKQGNLCTRRVRTTGPASLRRACNTGGVHYQGSAYEGDWCGSCGNSPP